MKEHPVKRRSARCPTHPGEVLREDVLPAIGVSVTAFARAIGVSRQTVHAILRGDKGITPAMALRIGKFVGNGPGLWLRMQQAHDLWVAERALAQTLAGIETHRAA
jgi:addiction module HigA family antidote